MNKLFIILCSIALSMGCSITSVHAAWFSATGQAAVLNGDRTAARQQATEEAIKQALLFAGASVRSVQQMTNGLLTDDHVEIRSSGEVSTIELIDEVYGNGIVTVSIRADIFSQDSKCSAADYTKRIASTYFPIRYPAQAADGQIHNIGEAAAHKMQTAFDQLTTSFQLSTLEPYVMDWLRSDLSTQAQVLADKSNVQYVLVVTLDDLAIERDHKSAFNFWKDTHAIRDFAFTLTLIDGANGDEVFSKQYQTSEAWEFAFTESVDVSSQRFWRSRYGKAINESIQKTIVDLEESIMCKPTMGRVLAVANNQLQINLGKNQKVKTGDRLTLFTVSQLQDSFGQHYEQFMLHPTTLIVEQVFSETATVASLDGSLLGNIQPNDYVARQ